MVLTIPGQAKGKAGQGQTVRRYAVGLAFLRGLKAYRDRGRVGVWSREHKVPALPEERAGRLRIFYNADTTRRLAFTRGSCAASGACRLVRPPQAERHATRSKQRSRARRRGPATEPPGRGPRAGQVVVHSTPYFGSVRSALLRPECWTALDDADQLGLQVRHAPAQRDAALEMDVEQ